MVREILNSIFLLMLPYLIIFIKRLSTLLVLVQINSENKLQNVYKKLDDLEKRFKSYLSYFSYFMSFFK
jgi:hypothetical protein